MTNPRRPGDKDRFLIAMPTRNREQVAIRSLTGLLSLARRDDVRLLVSDNSDLAGKALRDFCERNGIEYVRQDKVLRMTEHWDWVFRSQEFHGITITTDRSTVWPDAYLEAKALVEKVGHTVVAGEATYIRKHRFGLDFGVLSAQLKSGRTYEVPVRQIQREVYGGLVHTALPLPQNSILLRKEIDAVFARCGPLNSVSPDYELAYKYIHTFEDGVVTLLDKALTISHSKELSNGGGFVNKGSTDASLDFLKLNKLSSYQYSPLPHDLDSFSAVAHELNKILVELGREPAVKAGAVITVRSKALDQRPSLLQRRLKFLSTLFGTDRDHLLKIRLGYDPLDAQRIAVPVDPSLESYRPFFI